MSYKRFIIFISSIVAVAGCVKLAMACADWFDPYEAPSFFLNTVNKQAAFVPFYYTTSPRFYDEAYGFEQMGFDGNVPDPNTALWKNITGKHVSNADIDSFVYKYSANDVQNICDHISKNAPLKISQKIAVNGFTKWLLKNKDAAIAGYLAYAKRCEPYAASPENEWNDITRQYVTDRKDSLTMTRLMNEGVSGYNATGSNDLKLRYAYQSIRMAFYSRNNEQTIRLFNTLITTRSDNFLYCRCLALKAGALHRTNQGEAAAYLYSLTFDKSDEIKKTAITSFHWSAGTIGPVISLCKNDHEKAVVYIMNGLYDYTDTSVAALVAMQNAYALDPKVKGLDIVMTRCINKLERTAIPDMILGINGNDERLTALNTFAQKVAGEGKTSSTAYWLLASAYISLFKGDMPSCRQYLDKASSNKMTGKEQDVYYLLKTIYIAYKNGRIDAATESELLTYLKTLQERGAKEPRYNTVFSDMMVDVLKGLYLKQGDPVKAIYCFAKTYDHIEYYESWRRGNGAFADEAGQILENMLPEQLHKVEAFVLKKDKTPFEAWLVDHTQYTADVLYELEGTKYLRVHRFDVAAEVLKKVGEAQLRKAPLPDMFVSHIEDLQTWNSTDKLTVYNKLTFARKMLELEHTLRSDPADSRAAYQYANGLYSMSYYGKGHHAYDYYRHTSSYFAYFDYKLRSGLKKFELDYYAVQIPEQYYMQAFEHSNDQELKARCLFMAAKCRQKNCTPKEGNQNYYTADQGDYYINSMHGPYFKQLKQDYSNTEFYKSAIGTCSYFKDFVAMNK
jgi:hypothetical protein